MKVVSLGQVFKALENCRRKTAGGPSMAKGMSHIAWVEASIGMSAHTNKMVVVDISHK